jgi:RNA polymerase sigma factor (sigma-70 family)
MMEQANIGALNVEEFFQSVYAQYKRRVLNTALNMVQRVEDAEEIMQDVFVEVYFNLDGFRGESALGTWIYRITINKSLDFLKKKNRKKRFGWLTSLFDPESGRELHVISDFKHPGSTMENEEEISNIFLHIEKLPQKQKTALILSVMEQLSYDEISKVMDTSISSVESLLFRARKNLKNSLGNYSEKTELKPLVKIVAAV